MNTQRSLQNIQGLHRSQPDEVPALRGASEQDLPALTKKLSPTDSTLQMRNYFSLVESHWIYKLHSRAGTMPSTRWPTQNELSGIEGFFFKCYWTFAYILWFLMLWFYGFSVWVCVSLCVCAFSIVDLHFKQALLIYNLYFKTVHSQIHNLYTL